MTEPTKLPQFHEMSTDVREAIRPLEDFQGITLPQLWGEVRSAIQKLEGLSQHDQITPLRFIVSGNHGTIPKVEQLDGKLWGEVVSRTLLQVREPDRLLPLVVGLSRYTSRPWTGPALMRAAIALMGLHQMATLLFQLGGSEILHGLGPESNPAMPAEANVVLDERPETTSLGADGVGAILRHLPPVNPQSKETKPCQSIPSKAAATSGAATAKSTGAKVPASVPQPKAGRPTQAGTPASGKPAPAPSKGKAPDKGPGKGKKHPGKKH